MSYDFEWLQFFADGASGGADGGEGADTGVTTADAGRELEDLGVPKDKAEQYRKRRAGKQLPAQAKAAETEKPAGMDWDTFMEIPEHKQKLQDMMAERGRKAAEERRAAGEQIGKITPMLKLLGEHYGIEPKDGQYDMDAIIKAVTDDDLYYEDRALEKGESVAAAKNDWRTEYEQEIQRKRDRETQLQQHFLGMQQQANKLRELFPDFDLNRELQNPVFLQRTSPEGGMSVEDAFYSIHHAEVMEKQAEALARRVKADVASSIRAGKRPRENGSAAAAAASGTPDLHQMNRAQRLAYIRAKYGPG